MEIIMAYSKTELSAIEITKPIAEENNAFVYDAEFVKEGEKVTAPENLSKEGYEFTGWYLEGTTTAYDFNTPVSGDMTLTAGWKEIEVVVPPTPEKEYTVTFKDGETTVSSNTVKKGDTVAAPAPAS